MCTNGLFACASGMQIMHAKRQAGKNQNTFSADFGEIEISTRRSVFTSGNHATRGSVTRFLVSMRKSEPACRLVMRIKEEADHAANQHG